MLAGALGNLSNQRRGIIYDITAKPAEGFRLAPLVGCISLNCKLFDGRFLSKVPCQSDKLQTVPLFPSSWRLSDLLTAVPSQYECKDRFLRFDGYHKSIPWKAKAQIRDLREVPFKACLPLACYSRHEAW